MEEGEPDDLSAWETYRELSLIDLKRVYGRLNVSFDEYHGESMYPQEACRGVLQAMENAGLLQTLSDGRKVSRERGVYVDIQTTQILGLRLGSLALNLKETSINGHQDFAFLSIWVQNLTVQCTAEMLTNIYTK